MARSGPNGSAEQLQSPNVRAYLTRRQDIETRIPGVSSIQRVLDGIDVLVASSTGADIGSGEVTLSLSDTGVSPGQYNTFIVDGKGRIVKAWNENNAGGGGNVNTGISNQFSAQQPGSFWISGPARIDGSVSATSLTVGAVTASTLSLTTPLSSTYGGTGVTTAPANYVFVGPASGDAAAPSWRRLASADLPNMPWTRITNTPTTVEGYGILDVYTKSMADSTFVMVGGSGGSGTTSAVSIADWQTYKPYVDQVVTYQLRLFKCTTVHTSGASFDPGYWHEFVSGASAHSQITGLNDDPLVQHVKTADITKWNGYQAQLDSLAAAVAAIQPGGTPASTITLVNDSSLNGLANVDWHTVSQVKFGIAGASPTDTVILNDATKVTTTPSNLRGAIAVQQISGAWYLLVNLANVTYGASCTISVGTGCVLVNNTAINSNSVTCQFTTAGLASQPIVGQSLTNGNFGLSPSSLTSVVFPVTVASGNLALQLAAANSWSCSPANIVVGSPTVDAVANTITFTLAGAVSDTQYSLSVNAGLVSNNGDTFNTGTTTAVFGTVLSTPVVGSSPDDGSTTVDVTAAGRYVSFPVSTSEGRGNFDIADATKITITGATSGGASIVSGNLRVYYTGGNDGDTVTFNVAAGAIKNYNSLGDVSLSTNAQAASITYAVRPPVLSQPATNGNQDVLLGTSTVLVPFTSNSAVTLDTGLISSTPAGIVTAAAISGSNIALTLGALLQNQAVSITLASGVIKALNVTPNVAPLTTTFRVAASEPVIAQSPLNGTSIASGSATTVTFAVTGTDTLALVNASKVTISPAAGAGVATLSGGVLTLPVTLVDNTNYTVTVQAGAVKNRNTLNSAAVVCNFATATAFSVGQSPINGTRVPSSTTTVTFPLVNVNGTAVLNDAGKITGANCTVSSPVVTNSALTVQISGLGFSANASVIIAAGALRDSIMTNPNAVTCAFTTQGSVPVVGTGTLAGQTTVPTGTAFVEFPVTCSGTLTMANASLVTSVPGGAISSSVITGSIGAYKLRVNLTAMTGNTNYTINIAAGAVSNDGTLNTATQTCSWKTVEAAPVLGQSPANGTTVDAAGLTSVTFPITSSSTCTVANATKATVTGGPSISIVTISGSNLVVALSGVAVSSTIAISLASGLIANGDGVTNTNTVSTTITTKGDAPVIAQSVVQGLTSLAISPAYIEYVVTATGTVTVANANLVTVSPNHLQSVSMVAGKLRVAINMVSNTNYTVNIAAGLLVNNLTPSATVLTTTFKTALPVPVVGQSVTNGTIQPTSFASLDFPVTNPGTLSVANAALVTATNATVSGVTISGNNVRVALSGLTNSKSVAVTVGVGSISNGDFTNTAATTCTFTTQGSVPVVGQSPVNGTTPARTITTVDFPITNASGTLTVANASLVHATAGFDAIVTGVAINGSNLRVTLNGTLVFNKAYSISVDAGAVANDGVVSSNAVICAFTTQAAVPVVGQSSVHGVRQPIANQTISFPITVGAVAGTLAINDASKITVTGGTKGTPSISGSNLLVPVTGMTNSSTVSIAVAADAVKNNTVTNTAAITCTFSTVGVVPVVVQNAWNGTSGTVATGAVNVDFAITTSIAGALSLDTSKITSSPAAIASTPTVVNVSGTNYIRVPMTLAGTTAYTINIAAGAVINDTTLSTNVISCAFTTAAGAARPILWEFQFTYPNAALSIDLATQPGWGSNTLSSTDIYGPAYDGAGAIAELRWYGYVGNINHPEGVLVPRDGIDVFAATNPDGAYTFDDSIPGRYAIGTWTGSPSAKVYKIIRYVA